MGEIEKRAGAVAPPWWQFLPIGAFIGASYGLAQLEIWWAAIACFIGLIVCVALTLKTTSTDTDSWKIHSTTPTQKRQMWMQLLVPLGTFGVSALAGDSLFTFSPELTAIVTGTAIGAATAFSATRYSTLFTRISRERVHMIVEQASLDSVSTSDLASIDHDAPRTLIRGLLACGAIDGTRVMARQLARVLDWDVEQVHTVASPMEKRGITTRSSIMAGNDRGKIFVELTPKGVVLMKELSLGR